MSAGELFIIFGLILAVLLAVPMLILVAMLMRTNGAKRKCPHCAEIIALEARVCRFCDRSV